MHNLQGIMQKSLFRVNFNISRTSVTNILELKLPKIKNIAWPGSFSINFYKWNDGNTIDTYWQLLKREWDKNIGEFSKIILSNWKCHLRSRYIKITGIRFSANSSILKVWFFNNFCVPVKVYWKEKTQFFETAEVAIRNCSHCENKYWWFLSIVNAIEIYGNFILSLNFPYWKWAIKSRPDR